MRSRNILAGLVLIGLCAVYGYFTSQLPARTLHNVPDPSFFPWVNTAIIVTLSAVMVLQGLAMAPGGGAKHGGDRRSLILGGGTLAAFLVYIVALPGLGFLLATAPFFALLMVLYGERRPVWVVLGSAGVTVGLYGLFRFGFTVMLPRGLLAEWVW